MSSNSNYRTLVIFVVLINTHNINGFVNLPKIVTKDGNLMFYAGQNRNISFHLSGNSRLKINDEIDVMELFSNGVTNKANFTDSPTCNANVLFNDLKTDLTAVKTTVYGKQGLSSRLQTLQRGSLNITRRMRAYQNRLQQIEGIIRTMNSRVNKDNCESNPCQNGGTCFSLFNKFMCKCTKNFEGTTCEKDVNECALFENSDLGCQNGGQCVNQHAGYSCICNPGWYGIHCTKRQNDCTQSSSWELCGHGVCVASHDSIGFKCICDQGWTKSALSPSCTIDVDECQNSTTPCITKCINLPGSFACAPCDNGLTGNGITCRDINECAENNGGCSITPLVPCINSYGSHYCGDCPYGWVGDGRTCTRSENNDNSVLGTPCKSSSLCHPAAACTEISNSVICTCPAGMVGHGIGPNGCTKPPPVKCDANPCLNGGNCVNTASGYTCVCPRGYLAPNCAAPASACLPNPCKNSGGCREVGSSGFKCTCLQGFHGRNCELRGNRCGGIINADSGQIKYPTSGAAAYAHNEQCAWILRTNRSSVLNVTFNVFELEHSTECRFDWLQINDGPSAGSQIIGRFCGSNKPRGGNIVSTTNELYMWFKSDNSSARAGFELEWNSIAPQCGGVLNVTSHGTISSPGSPGKYPRNRDCVWQLRAPNTKRIKLTFFILKLEDHSTCNFDFLEITDAMSNYELEKFCTTSNPTPLLLSTNEADIRFHSDEEGNDFGFQIFYSLEERIPGCGGVFNDKDGTIVSPLSIAGVVLSCEYEIHASSNESIVIDITEFDQIADNCIEFYNVNEDKGTSVLEIKYCGNYGFKPPHFQSRYNRVLLKYFTNGGHFEMKYTTDCSYTFDSPSDVITSPGYASIRHKLRTCTLRILTEPGSVIELSIKDFDMKDPSNDDQTCNSLTYLKLTNGLNGEVQGQFCGNNTPGNEYVVRSNLVILEYSTSDYAIGRGFKLEYKSVPMRSGDCGGVLTKPTDKIHSPSTESGTYAEEMLCYWIIVAPPSKNIALNWEYFDIEEENDCSYDYVEIYENLAANAKPFGRYCGSQNPPTFVSHSTILTLKFVSDDSNGQRGFAASYSFVDKFNCGGNIFSASGELTTPDWPQNYTNNMDCIWIITAPMNTQIELKFEMFELEVSEDCNRDSLSIRNGASEASILIGKFCGKSVPRAVPSFTNQLHLHLHTDASQTASGFRLTWQVFSNNCGGTLKGETGVITSPFYPNAYPNDAECEWSIHVHKGSSIHIKIESLEIEDLSTCAFDYLEIVDGLNDFSQAFPRICALSEQSKRDFVTSQSDAIIRFRTDGTQTRKGFLLSYYANCSQTLHNLHGIIESPNYDERNYKSDNINCSWTIKAPKGNNILIEFSYVNDKSNNSAIYIYNVRNKSTQEITSTQTLNTFSDNIVISQISSSISFRLEYNVVGCVGTFTADTGSFHSPNFPRAYGNDNECLWEIRVPLGRSIEISIAELDIEESVNCTKDYLQISPHRDNVSAKERHCGKATDMNITSSAAHLFVRFNSDASNNGKGFSATYRSVNIACGGLLKAKHGVITSPNYPKNYAPNLDCEWTIMVNSAHRMAITLEELDLEDTYDCELDLLEAYEVENIYEERQLFRLCGSTIDNNGYFETISGIAKIRFRSDASYEAKGFKLTFNELCGMDFIVDGYGDSFDFNEATGNENCLYRFFAKNPSERVMLLITHVHMNSQAAAQYRTEEECQANGIKIYEGSNVTYSVRASFCKIHPETIYSNGHVLTMRVPTKLISELEGHYMVADSFCGGTYNAFKGKFSTPYYPSAYSVNMDCEWYITANAGNSIVLIIESMDLEESEDCNKDFLEVRNSNNRGELLGLFCGKQPPTSITAPELWIKFRSDNDIVSSGFIASYNYAEHNELNGTSGIIESPRYPSPFYSNTPHSWRISVDKSSRIILHFKHITDAIMSTIKVYDGYSDIGLPIDMSNGNLLQSSSSILFITARRGPFSFEWESISKYSVNESNEVLLEKCGYVSLITVDQAIVFNSPGYPNGYQDLMECNYKFAAHKSSNHVVMKFTQVDLEESNECMTDYLQISSSSDLETWHVLDKICSLGAAKTLYEGTPYLKLTFSTDVSINQTGFSARIEQKCGSELTQPRSVLNITDIMSGDKKPFECIWTIRVRRSHRIRLSFLTSNLNGPLRRSDGNYIIVRNGMSVVSPFLGQGKYTTNDIADVLETSSNRAYIKFVYVSGNADVVLHYEEIGNECSDEIVLNDETLLDASRIITSPNYPNLPNPHTECIWIIRAPVQHAIAVNFVSKFEMAPVSGPLNNTCVREYIQLNDGSSEIMPLMGQYCGDTKPNSMVTTSNVLRIKYFTDISEPHVGFMLNVSIATCGGTYYTNENFIRSPANVGLSMAKKNFECIYVIELPRYNTIDLVVQKAILPHYGQCQDDTHLELQEMDVVNDAENMTDSVVLCGDLNMAHYIVETHKLIIRFKIKELSNYMFDIKYKAIGTRCGETIEAGMGILQSPGYPEGVRSYTRCNWYLRVPKGRRIKVEFLDFDVGNGDVTFTAGQWPHPSHGNLLFSNNYDHHAIITIVYKNPPNVIYSSDNIMMISATLTTIRQHRGFKLRFSSNENTILCNNHFNLNAAIHMPQQISFNMTKGIAKGYCNYDINVPLNHTLALHFTNFKPYFARYVPVELSYNKQPIFPDLFLQSNTSAVARVAFPITMELFSSRSENLNVEYQVYECGGIIYHAIDMIRLTQPTMNDGNYTGRLECVWSVLSAFEESDDGTQFVLSFQTDFKDGCDKQYLKIYNGPTQGSPLLGKFCTKSSATNLVILHGVLIEYYTEQYDRRSNFSVELKEGEVCGGSLSYPFHKINFYNLYKNNMECIWTVTAKPGYHIGLHFEDRFFIESSKNCTKDYLLVQQKTPDGDWLELSRICGRQPPLQVNSTSEQMRLIFRSDSETTGDGFIAAFERNCGGIFYAGKDTKNIISPGYPIAYDSNCNCNYTIVHADVNSRELLNVRFVNFELEGGSVCIFDIVTVRVFTSPDEMESENSYCGTENQLEFRAKEKIEIILKTDISHTDKGFSFEYREDKCGGIVQQPGIIETPKENNNNFPHLNKCFWNITAPTTHKILLKFEILDFESSNQCPFDGVEIFKGLMANEKYRIAKLCGNLTGNMPILSIPMNTALIYGYSDMTTSSRGFKVVVDFVPNCDKILFLTANNFTYDLNSFNYAANSNQHLDCTYVFSTTPGRQLVIQFSSFNFKQSENCMNNYVEIRDGLEPFADEIGKFCDTSAPQGLISSANALFIRFVRAHNDTTIGFQAQIKSVPLLCGQHDMQLNETKSLTIKSPDNGASGLYANNLYCYWRIRSKSLIKIKIDKLDIDTRPAITNGSCGGDYLKIISVLTDGDEVDSIEKNIYHGDFNVKDSFDDAAEHMFCGNILPHDYYPNSREVRIKFKTDAEYAKSGFKLTISPISHCLRNYTGTQGRILIGEIDNDCDVYINAPGNHSLSLYFSNIDFFDYYVGEDYLEIIDVHNNQSLEKINTYFDLGKALFTTTNQIHLHLHSKMHYGKLDLTFLASTQGPGCGGDLFNTVGIITSPFYPNEVRTNADCRWNIRVPSNVHVYLKFEEFQFGAKNTCHSDYLQIIEYDDATGQEIIQRQFCGGDRPNTYKSSRSSLSLRLHKTVNFDGTGFVITFKGVFANFESTSAIGSVL